MIRVEVAVVAPLFQTLTYSIKSDPAGYDPAVPELIGFRVQVPLGRRKASGYILGFADTASTECTIKPISLIVDGYPLFSPNLVPLFRWLAEYYHYPIGEIIHIALPKGLARTSRKWLEVTALGKNSPDRLTELMVNNDAIFADLFAEGHLTPEKTCALTATPAGKRCVTHLIDEGLCRMQESFLRDKVREKTQIVYSLPFHQPGEKVWPKEVSADSLKEFARSLPFSAEHLKTSAIKTLYVLTHLLEQKNGGKISRKDLLARYPNATTSLPTLLAAGHLLQESQRIYRSPFGENVPSPKRYQLTDAQAQAVQQMSLAIEKRIFTPFLLYGVTGSGKTEVYLQAAEYALSHQLDVLILVPEIALATQLEEQVLSRFGEQVALLHSGLSASERFDQWSLILLGQAKLVIGARSAIFAPLAHPGLIVVDEEHDGGFKQDDTLRYNARDVAVMRAKIENATVVLASATPSITSYSNAVNGKYTLLRLPARIGARRLPDVQLLNLTKKEGGKRQGIFRPPLLQAIADTLNENKQSVILLNRRGYSTTVVCQECGAPVECTHCRVSLTWHKGRNELLCHYCGFSCHPQTVCMACGSLALAPLGFGTERIEEELQGHFPDARIARIDTDTATDRRQFLKILQDMHERKIDILVGTQMVAKGHHFPHVTLVGVVLADGGLNIPDFRAAEKTFQLLVQAIGRAGRGDDAGRVYIQTYRPDHYAIRFAQAHQFEEMVERELSLRQRPVFPPFVRLVSFLFQGKSSQSVQETANRLARLCQECIQKNFRNIAVLGPAPAPIEKIRGKYRWQVLLKGNDIEQLHALCGRVIGERKKLAQHDCTISVDVDPENML